MQDGKDKQGGADQQPSREELTEGLEQTAAKTGPSEADQQRSQGEANPDSNEAIEEQQSPT